MKDIVVNAVIKRL